MSEESGSWKREIQDVADAVRRRVLDHVLKHNGGYMSQACSSAEIFALLYARVMRLGPSVAPMVPRRFGGVPGKSGSAFFTGGEYNGPREPHYDRFIFSPAHYALVLYATLVEVGRLAESGLAEFNQDGSTVEMIGAEHSPGVETTTGSLGQALSHAGGIALARRQRGDTGDVWVFMSDGEFQEGQTWEAIDGIARFGLDHLRVVIDANGQQVDGRIDRGSASDVLVDRIRAFGVSAVEVSGHDLVELDRAMSARPGRPHFVVARTNPVQGLELFGERAPLLHYLRFTSEEERARYQAAYEKMVVA